MKFVLGLSVFLMVAVPCSAQAAPSASDHPAPSVDEVHLAVQVGARLAVLEMCGHHRPNYPIMARYKRFLASHRDETGSGDIEKRVKSGVALQLLGQQKQVKKLCAQLGEMQETLLSEKLDQLDLPMRKAHYLAGHVPIQTAEHQEMESLFGPRKVALAPSQQRFELQNTQSTDEGFSEPILEALAKTVEFLPVLGELKSLGDAAVGNDIITGKPVAGLDVETGKMVEGRCAFVKADLQKTFVMDALKKPIDEPRPPRSPAMALDLTAKVGTKAVIGIIGVMACAAEN